MAGGRIALAALAVLGACGGGNDDKAADTTVATIEGETTSSSAPPEGGPASGGGATTTTKPGTSGAASGGAATTTPTTARSGSTSASSSSRFAAAGNYVYNRSGKRTITGLPEQSMAGQGTLRVDPPNGDDQRTFVEYSSSESTEQTLRSVSGSVQLIHLKTETPYRTTEFRPSPPVMFAPDPASAGRTWSWRITSTDGQVSVDGSFKVLGNETVVIGGEPVDTVVVEANLTLSGGIVGTSKQRVWASPKHRLAVRTDDVTDTSSPFVSHAESSSVLSSTKPS